MIRIGEYQEKLLAVHDITGGLSHPRVVVLEVAGQYFGYSRIRYLRQSESCGGTDQRTPFFEEREKALRGYDLSQWFNAGGVGYLSKCPARGDDPLLVLGGIEQGIWQV